MDYYEITNTSPEYSTIGDFISDTQNVGFPIITKIKNKTVIVNGVQSSVPDYDDYAGKFIYFENVDGIKNIDRIKAAYCDTLTIQEIDRNINSKSYSKIPIKEGIKFIIPKNNVDRASLLSKGIEVVSNNVPAFKASKLAELEADEGYVSARKSISGYNSVYEKYPDLTVWVWCRGLSEDTSGKTELQGQIFDVSPFIQNINTKVNKNGGNFTITLAPLMCYKDLDGIWRLEKTTKTNNESSSNHIEYITEGSIVKQVDINGERQTKVSQFLFHNIISSNDLVFIRFETLELEKKQRQKDYKLGYISKENLPNRIYDMIGLVNRNNKSANYESNDASISITGTDLTKLFLEDGTYFYPFEMKGGVPKFSGQSTANSSLTQRVTPDGQLLYLSLYFNTSVENIIKFVIQQLSTIKIVPDNLFSAYGDRVNVRYTDVEPDKFDKNKKELDNIFKKGVDAVKSARVAEGINLTDKDEENIIANGGFQQLLNFIKYIRDENNKDITDTQSIAIINSNSTVGWLSHNYNGDSIPQNCLPSDLVNKYGLINPNSIEKQKIKAFNKPSVNLNGQALAYGSNFNTYELEVNSPIKIDSLKKIIKICDEYFIKEKSNKIYVQTIPQKQSDAKGIWQIVKLVIDKDTAKRRLIDSSISSANGSLMNYIKKCCQEPFVEFYADTYGDMYYLIVRKPPYDKKGFMSMLQEQYKTEKGDINGAKIVEIDSSEIYNDNLYYGDGNAISWYHFTPQNSFFGGVSEYALSFIPAIYFEEYAEIWGSKVMDKVNNYTPYLNLDQGQESQSWILKQAFEDLRYMVESSAYLPFTRQGTLTLRLDRRIKIGNIVRLKSTGEVFYVEDVTHNVSINDKKLDATTTVTLSRGMVEKYIRGVEMESKKDVGTKKIFSYFNIINTDLDFTKTKDKPETKEIKKTIKKTIEFENNSNVNPYVDKVIPIEDLKMDASGIKMLKDLETGGKSIQNLLTPTRIGNEDRGTVGYGSTYYWDENPIKPIPKYGAPKITIQRAESLFNAGLKNAETKVKKAFNDFIGLTRNQYTALVIYTYQQGNLNKINEPVRRYLDSIGVDKKTTTLMEKEMLKNKLILAWSGQKYNKESGKRGVNVRRETEIKLFFNVSYAQVDTEEEITEKITTTTKVFDESNVFSKMVVDKEIFNFFLTKQHIDN